MSVIYYDVIGAWFAMHIVAMVFKRGCGNILLDMDPHVRTFAIFDDSFSTKERFVEDSAVVGFRITILPFTEIFVSCFSRTTCLDVWRLSNLWKKILVSMADFWFTEPENQGLVWFCLLACDSILTTFEFLRFWLKRRNNRSRTWERETMSRHVAQLLL